MQYNFPFSKLPFLASVALARHYSCFSSFPLSAVSIILSIYIMDREYSSLAYPSLASRGKERGTLMRSQLLKLQLAHFLLFESLAVLEVCVWIWDTHGTSGT